MDFKKLKHLFFFLIFQIIFSILFVSPSFAADVYTLDKTLEAPEAGIIYYANSVAVGDFNNDGYGDLAIAGKPSGGGNVYVYYGSSSGIGDTPDSTLTGIANLTSFTTGFKVHDLNLDSYDDLIVSSSKYHGDYSYEGRIFVWYGQSNYLSGSADFTYGGSGANEMFGGKVEIANLTGDGYPELIVTGPGYDSSRGKVYIFLGKETLSGSPDYTMEGENQGDDFYEITTGKFNQDGYYDLLVGADGYDSNRGKIYVYYGGSTFDNTTDTAVQGENESDRFGDGVDAADFNNDGYDEALVGAWGYNGLKGRVYVYYGPNGIDTSADVKIDTDHSSCYLGTLLGSSNKWVGKINSDGFNDLILSCYSANSDTGELYLHYGGSGQISASPNLTITGEETDSRYGVRIEPVDLNNNGYDDLLVKASEYNSWTGRVYIYWGGNELDTSEEQKLTGESTNDSFGSFMLGADFDNDGYKELVLSHYHRTVFDDNKVYLYDLNHGSPSLSVNNLGYIYRSDPSINGSIAYSGVNVAGIEAKIDGGDWIALSSLDGSFNSSNENYAYTFSSLTEGGHNVSVRSYHADYIYLPITAYGGGNFYVDTTVPTISELAIVDVASVSQGGVYELEDTNRMPFFSGKAFDLYHGVGDDDKVSAGPSNLILNLKKLDAGENPDSANPSYTNYLTKKYGLTGVKNDFEKEKYVRFYVTTPYPLEDGYYQVNFSLTDRAENIYYYQPFYLSLNYQTSFTFPSPSPGTGLRLIEEERISAETEEERQRIKEEGYIVQIRVVDENGNPVQGAKVILYSEPREAYTNEEGIAIFKNIEPGEHKIVVAQNSQQGEQEINLIGDYQEFRYTLQIKAKSPFLDLRVILVFLTLLVIIFLLAFLLLRFYKRRG